MSGEIPCTQCANLQAEITYLKEELSLLRRLIYGQRRERFIPTSSKNQQELALGVFDNQEEEAETEEITYRRRKNVSKQGEHPGRYPIPAHFPRRRIVIEPEGDISGLRHIGEEITEELEYKKPEFYVNQYIRPKYELPNGDGILIGHLPSRPIEKGIPGPGLLSHIIISKYVDHIPIYRMRRQFARHDLLLSESTICGWIGYTFELLRVLNEAYREKIQASHYLMVDETPIRVLEKKKKGKSHKGFLWVYYDPLAKRVLFDYRSSRSRAGPKDILDGYAGYIQTDGYTVYDDLSKRKEITSVCCMAHARRYFEQAQDGSRKQSVWMLKKIGTLYDIEREAREKGIDSDQRYLIRQEKSKPILDEMKTWLDEQLPALLPKSLIGKSVHYMKGHWDRLEAYISDGCLEIDNNLVENEIRPVALGRKNYMFAGSHDGARRAALLYTIVANAKLQGIEPFNYLRDVLRRISDYPVKQIEDLMAENWESNSISE